MSVYGRILIAGFGSLSLLLGALAFQYLGGLAPCPMCIWQRWPHLIAVALSVLGLTLLWRHHRPVAAIGALSMMASAVLGAYHTGVEQLWWPGPDSCTVMDPSAVSSDQLLSSIMDAPLVRCDEIVWDLFGLSMAAWNALISTGLAAIWLFAALPRTVTRHKAPA